LKPTQGFTQAAALADVFIKAAVPRPASPRISDPRRRASARSINHVYTGVGDGSILRVNPRTGSASVFANTGGRPLGVTFDASGERLYVADADRGLLSVSRDGKVSRSSRT